MEIKKTKQADITRRSSTYFLIGLNVVLLLTLLFLEFSRKFVEPEEKVVAEEVIDIPEEALVVERQFDEPPPPDVQVTPPEIPIEVKPIDNDIILDEPVEIQTQNDPIPDRNTYAASSVRKVDRNPPPLPPTPPPAKVPKPVADKKVTRATALRGPIYPGCEKYENNKRELYNCFNDKITSDLQGYLDRDFDLGSGEVRKVFLKFEIDANGKMKLLTIDKKGSEEEFGTKAKQAFNELASFLEKRGNRNASKGVRPALNTDKQNAAMDYVIPVTFEGSR